MNKKVYYNRNMIYLFVVWEWFEIDEILVLFKCILYIFMCYIILKDVRSDVYKCYVVGLV